MTITNTNDSPKTVVEFHQRLVLLDLDTEAAMARGEKGFLFVEERETLFDFYMGNRDVLIGWRPTKSDDRGGIVG